MCPGMRIEISIPDFGVLLLKFKIRNWTRFESKYQKLLAPANCLNILHTLCGDIMFLQMYLNIRIVRCSDQAVILITDDYARLIARYSPNTITNAIRYF